MEYLPNSVFQATTIIRNIRFRYFVVNAGTITTTPAKLLDCCGLFARTVNIASSIASSVRVRSVEAWAAPFAAGAAAATASVKLNWGDPTTAISAVSRDVMATSTNPSQPAHIFARPPMGQKYYSGEWNASTNTPLFGMTLPSSSILELTLDFVIKDFGDNSTTTDRVTGANTVGGMYYGQPDSLTAAGSIMSCIGRANTA